MSRRTFIDTGVLIAAVRGTEPLASRAFAVLDDPERVFTSSDFVRLEVLPKPVYLKRNDEVEFHEEFFSRVAEWAMVTAKLIERAHELACATGLDAVDSIHLAAAESTQTEELVTTEKPGKALFRAPNIRVSSISADGGQ